MRHRRRWLMAKGQRVARESYLDAKNLIRSWTWPLRDPDQYRYARAIRRYVQGRGPYAVLA